LQHSLQSRQWQLQQLAQRVRAQTVPLAEHQRSLSALEHRMQTAQGNRIQLLRQRLHALGDSLNHLDPLRVLDRGYAMVTDSQGTVLRDTSRVAQGAQIAITLARGQLGASVNIISPAEKAQSNSD
jgi:exodeoxyribonuclease VII large subunit